MELVTLCPHCQTRFTVNVEQLQRRKGYIRCPQCAAIFDGFEQVVPEGPQPQTPRSVTQADGLQQWQPAPTPVSVSHTPTVERAQPFVPAVDETPEYDEADYVDDQDDYDDEDAHNDTDDQDAEPIVDSVEWISARYEPPADDAPHQPIYEDPDEHREDDDPFFVSPRAGAAASREPAWRIGVEQDDTSPVFIASGRDRDEERPYHRYDEPHDLPRSVRLARLFWMLVALILVGVLAVQALYVFRLQIASAVPMTRPVLEALCTKLGCTVPYVRNIADIKVVSSALQVQQAGSGSSVKQYQLRVRLRNADSQAQEWPSLVVTFTDVAAAVVARVEVLPEQYLTVQQLKQPFAAQSEIEFVLPVQSATRINGYKIDKYFR
ncbi:zinc-ribbon and DUF3426 domain-containing protein [Paenalcaligenes sp. Me131]|uniref:zinc-ribbon and DUF3426 domain-containing protein n=1 Tax=Paenalcaligenes sp. Me131 TaxID=3392636 RepID=UPI003D2C4EC1